MQKVLLSVTLLYLLSTNIIFAQKTCSAYGFKLTVPSNWEVVDEQTDYNFYDIQHPDANAVVHIETYKGTTEAMSKHLIFSIKAMAWKAGIENGETILTEEYIGEKLSEYTNAKGLNFLRFEYEGAANQKGKKGWVIVQIAKTDDKMTLFCCYEEAMPHSEPIAKSTIKSILDSISR